jgi:hypothetical protein
LTFHVSIERIRIINILVKEKTMENQHRKITGYRELTQEEIKAQGRTLAAMVARLEALQSRESIAIQGSDLPKDEFLSAVAAVNDARQWLHEGKIELQKGLMFLTRAVARPTSF